MEIYRRMYDLLRQRALESRIRSLSIGLGYTAVVLDDESIGIAYTWIGRKTSCALLDDPTDYEGQNALPLLEKLFVDDFLSRSVALATVNALNYANSVALPTDAGTLLDDLGVVDGSRISMIGHFAPIVKQLQERNAVLNIYDLGKDLGSADEYSVGVQRGVDACIISSTSIINGSTEALLAQIGEETPCALLGPTTPMLPEVFTDPRVRILAGTCPHDVGQVLKAVRHAQGTHAIHRTSRKVYWRR